MQTIHIILLFKVQAEMPSQMAGEKGYCNVSGIFVKEIFKQSGKSVSGHKTFENHVIKL